MRVLRTQIPQAGFRAEDLTSTITKAYAASEQDAKKPTIETELIRKVRIRTPIGIKAYNPYGQSRSRIRDDGRARKASPGRFHQTDR